MPQPHLDTATLQRLTALGWNVTNARAKRFDREDAKLIIRGPPSAIEGLVAEGTLIPLEEMR